MLRRIAVTFDIDGVLLRGKALLPGARQALVRLQKARVPYLFVTNGGGETEASKARSLAEMLEVPVHPQQVVLSHSPLKRFVQQHDARGEKLLVMGCKDVMGVIRSYGARRAYDIPALAQDDPHRYPFQHVEPHLLGADRAEPFGAVFVLHDPSNWAPEIQIALDVVRGGWPFGSGGATQTIPVYASNPDIVFAGSYPVPRLGGGAFTSCLQHMFKKVTGNELKVTQCGKPTKITYDFALSQLQRWDAALHRHPLGFPPTDAGVDPVTGGGPLSPAAHPPFDHIYHIGDNPAADIRGALQAGRPWQGVLVRTGVFDGGDNDADHPAHAVVAGVTEAVDYALASAAAQ